jgi:tetratricopeptide (TPR) repeat protein
MLGSLFADREQWFEAAAHFRQAVAIAGAHPQLLTGLGQALLRLGRDEEARQPLDAASAANPNALEPLVYLAELEERGGAFEQATRLLDRAQGLARRQGTDVDLQRSVLLARMGQPEQAFALLEAKSDLSGAALLHRGRLGERLGRFAEAWSDWTKGKAELAKRAGRHYAADHVNAQADRLSHFLDSSDTTHGRWATPRRHLPQPIFIIGFPRSGTTLVEQILASHSAIRAGGELPFGHELREYALATAGNDLAVAAPLWKANCAEHLRNLYLARAETRGLLAKGASYFTDKMPDNSFSLPLMRLAFPDAPVILVRRHPLDVVTSVMAHDMTHGFNCGYRLETAAQHYALVDRLLERFRASGLGATHELHYETLVRDQDGETRRLMTAVGLQMEPWQLRFHERASVPATPSYAQVREPLNNRAIGRWRNFAKQLEAVTPILAEAMVRGGYAL